MVIREPTRRKTTQNVNQNNHKILNIIHHLDRHLIIHHLDHHLNIHHIETLDLNVIVHPILTVTITVNEIEVNHQIEVDHDIVPHIVEINQIITNQNITNQTIVIAITTAIEANIDPENEQHLNVHFVPKSVLIKKNIKHIYESMYIPNHLNIHHHVNITPIDEERPTFQTQIINRARPIVIGHAVVMIVQIPTPMILTDSIQLSYISRY